MSQGESGLYVLMAVGAVVGLGIVLLRILLRKRPSGGEAPDTGAAGRDIGLSAFSPASLQRLMDDLSNERVEVRWDAARKLREYGPRAAKAIPKLEQLLNDRDGLVRRTAEEALAAIKEREGNPNPQGKVRCGKCRALNDEASKFCNQCGAAM
jgi:hypothetical protein